MKEEALKRAKGKPYRWACGNCDATGAEPTEQACALAVKEHKHYFKSQPWRKF